MENGVLKIFGEMFASIEMNCLAWLSYFPSFFIIWLRICVAWKHSSTGHDDSNILDQLYRYFAPNLTQQLPI